MIGLGIYLGRFGGSGSSSLSISDIVNASSSTSLWAPTDDGSRLWQDTAATSAANTTGDPVARINSAAGTVNALQATAGRRPDWDEADGLLFCESFNDDGLTVALSTRSADMYVAIHQTHPAGR